MSTTSTEIFSNPLFATYSVYARNASNVVKWRADEYNYPSYNILIRVSSLQVPELTSANVLHNL